MSNENMSPQTTKACLLIAIDEYLGARPEITEESFGWFAVQDSTLISRLRSGKDVTTRKLDKILAFIHHNQ